MFAPFFGLSVPIPPPATHTSSCPTALTTTVRPIPLTCIPTGGVWSQGQALPFPSSLLPPHPTPPPPPRAPLVHGHVRPQPCCLTSFTTARWDPPWCLHHGSPAGRLVHHLSPDVRLVPILLCSTCNPCSFCSLLFASKSAAENN